jgi:hypothetical protein
MARAGYNPSAALKLWNLLNRLEEDPQTCSRNTSIGLAERTPWTRTHPTCKDRELVSLELDCLLPDNYEDFSSHAPFCPLFFNRLFRKLCLKLWSSSMSHSLCLVHPHPPVWPRSPPLPRLLFLDRPVGHFFALIIPSFFSTDNYQSWLCFYFVFNFYFQIQPNRFSTPSVYDFHLFCTSFDSYFKVRSWLFPYSLLNTFV